MKTIKREDELCVKLKGLAKDFVHTFQEQLELMDSLPESKENELLILETYQFNNSLRGIVAEVFDSALKELEQILLKNQ